MKTDFWKLIAANFIITAAMYFMIPTLPQILLHELDLNPVLATAATSITGIAVFALGPFCSYSIQRFRRNKVCISSIAITAATFLIASYIIDEMQTNAKSEEYAMALIATRIASGVFFGLSLIILNSTLIIDSCESNKRTQANAISSWTHLLAIPAGMSGGILTQMESNTQDVFYTACAANIIAIVLIMSTRFPFKAPEETIKKCSFDRFIATSCVTFAIPALFASMTFGGTAIRINNTEQLAYLGTGSIAAICCLILSRTNSKNKGKGLEKFRISRRGIAISACAGYAISLLSILLTIYSTAITVSHYATNAATACLGAGTILILSNIHLCLIESADHCQRGSAESTYLLTVELGTAIGIALYTLLYIPSSKGETTTTCVPDALSLVFSIISAITYFIIIWRKAKAFFK